MTEQTPATSRRDGAWVTRVDLSIGAIDLIRFVHYDHDFPRHSHDFFTLGVFATGSGALGYRGARWQASNGAILAVPPDEVHDAEPMEGEGWTYDALYPSRAMVALALGLDPDQGVPFLERPILDDAGLAAEILAVHRGLREGADVLANEEALLGVLRRLIERHGATRTAPEQGRGSLHAVAIARDYLHAHFAEPVMLQQLSTECRVSPFHLLRIFRDATGLPPHAYLTQLRCDHAREWLLQGVSLSSVAYRCGFADQSHFTRTFKRIFGVTPGAYQVAARPAA